ncbi:O-antigen ligase family protein [Sphingomonas citri]
MAGDLTKLRLILGPLAAATATYQIFTFAVFGTYFPLALLFSLSCAAFARVPAMDRTLFVIIAAYWLTLVLAALWSPDLGTWANGVLYESLFFVAFFYAQGARSEELSRILFVFILAAAANAVLVIIFRFLPGIEASYLNSELLNVFRNPKRVANYGQFKPNVFDPDKAGGIFDNANTGAAFNMLCFGCTIALIGARKITVLAPLLILFAVAIFCSGSKSAVLLTGTTLAIVAALYLVRSGRSALFAIVGFLVLGFLLAPPVQELLTSAASSDFGEATAKTSGYRINLLHVAGMLFRDHPLLGLGFGGWPRYMEPYAALYGLDPSWPPHNSLVNAWAQAGLVSALLLVAIFVIITSRLIRGFRSTERPFRPGGALLAMLAVAGMSLGDPFPLLGNQNMAFPLGLLAAWGVRSMLRRQQAPTVRRVRRSTRGSARERAGIATDVSAAPSIGHGR